MMPIARKIPQTDCEGCKDRDRLIAVLAKKLDDLERIGGEMRIPSINDVVGLVPDMTEGLTLKEYMDQLSDE